MNEGLETTTFANTLQDIADLKQSKKQAVREAFSNVATVRYDTTLEIYKLIHKVPLTVNDAKEITLLVWDLVILDKTYMLLKERTS